MIIPCIVEASVRKQCDINKFDLLKSAVLEIIIFKTNPVTTVWKSCLVILVIYAKFFLFFFFK